MDEELFAIRLALQERNERAQLRLRGLAQPELLSRPRLPSPSQLQRPAAPARRGPLALAGFLGRPRG